MTRVRNNTFRETRETVIDNEELGKALANAGAIDDEYFRLRAIAIISLLRLSGKRRTEISWIPLENFKVEGDLLNVTFSLEKKKAETQEMPKLRQEELCRVFILQGMRCGHLTSAYHVYVQTSEVTEGFCFVRPIDAKRFAILRVSKLFKSNSKVLVAIRQECIRELLHNP